MHPVSLYFFVHHFLESKLFKHFSSTDRCHTWLQSAPLADSMWKHISGQSQGQHSLHFTLRVSSAGDTRAKGFFIKIIQNWIIAPEVVKSHAMRVSQSCCHSYNLLVCPGFLQCSNPLQKNAYEHLETTLGGRSLIKQIHSNLPFAVPTELG